MTAVEWLIRQLEAPCRGIPSHIIEKAKEMEYKQNMNAMQKGMELQKKENNRVGFRERNGLIHSQTEISDEEIEAIAMDRCGGMSYESIDERAGIIWGAKWYREQLKKKQCI